jgi:hypothetical protein
MFIKIPKEKIEGHFHGEEGRRKKDTYNSLNKKKNEEYSSC